MDENNTWRVFESTGKITDYLTYKGYNKNESIKSTESFINANQNTGSYNKTAQYW